MEIVKFFVASSVTEFETQRKELGEYINSLNKIVYKKRGIILQWVGPENMSKAMERNGLQERYNQSIRESRLFFLIAGQKIGKYTREEFEIAWNQYCATQRYPKIFTLFLLPNNQKMTRAVRIFWNKLKKMKHYPQCFPDWNAVKTDITIQIARELPGKILNEDIEQRIDISDENLYDVETYMEKAIKHIADHIKQNNAQIAEWEKQGLTWDTTIPKILTLYEENARLIKKYYIEPDAIRAYADFLYKQKVYQEAIQILNWLGRLYAVDGTERELEARRLNLLGVCYYWSNDFRRAELCYRKALEIRRNLAEDNSVSSLVDVSITCNNLAVLLFTTNRMREAEIFYQEVLDIRRKLAQDNPNKFLSHLATAYNNLGLTLYSTNRMKEAEISYRNALDIRRKLAQENYAIFIADVAVTCNNLGILLAETNRFREAEVFYREALNIRRELARDNPSAFLPSLANSYNNLANLLSDTDQIREAEVFYREALNIRHELARDNPSAFLPDMAMTCNNLGNLLKNINRFEEAEKLCQEALNIRRRLAKGNLSAYGIDVAVTADTLADLMMKTNRENEAKTLYLEALTLFEKYPHRKNDIEKVRHKLSRYFPLS